ncbi:hypothetical protein BDZ88DRAFT_266457 [Geranomyces variabilis]|nr:hypothetical protein BDZ88DRAFT_266457 [Geranomyces variabilis]
MLPLPCLRRLSNWTTASCMNRTSTNGNLSLRARPTVKSASLLQDVTSSFAEKTKSAEKECARQALPRENLQETQTESEPRRGCGFVFPLFVFIGNHLSSLATKLQCLEDIRMLRLSSTALACPLFFRLPSRHPRDGTLATARSLHRNYVTEDAFSWYTLTHS